YSIKTVCKLCRIYIQYVRTKGGVHLDPQTTTVGSCGRRSVRGGPAAHRGASGCSRPRPQGGTGNGNESGSADPVLRGIYPSLGGYVRRNGPQPGGLECRAARAGLGQQRAAILCGQP